MHSGAVISTPLYQRALCPRRRSDWWRNVLHNVLFFLRRIPLQILCGCGALDGTEVSEAVSTAIHLRQKGMKPLFYAPDTQICGVVNHLTKEMESNGPTRNALVEAARLARSCVKPLCECDACTHGALILPGGFGTARTLYVCRLKRSNWMTKWDTSQLI